MIKHLIILVLFLLKFTVFNKAKLCYNIWERGDFMVTYKPVKGIGLYRLLGAMFLYNFIIIAAVAFIDTYVISSLLKLFLVLFNVYQLYYFLLLTTLKYGIDDEYLYIMNIFRKLRIPFKHIEGYQSSSENVNGIRLSGYSTNDFAIGKSFIKKIGTTNMFVTANKNIFYFKCGEINYAISPNKYDNFESTIKEKGVNPSAWEYTLKKETSLHKDRTFMLPFFIVTIINIILTLNPFILYLMDKLPAAMPLSFDSSFMPLELGTGKQFAFNQTIYGALNMVIQLCMYYASHFYAKYDRRSANKFIYSSLIISVTFLFIQLRILYAFR